MARRSTVQSGTTKSLIYSIICMLVGIGIFIGGIAVYKNPADCGGQTMQQGDTCEVTSNGSTTDNSISAQEASNHRDGVIMFVFGPLMLVGGGVWFAGEIRTRQRRKAAPAGAPPFAAAGAPPFPGQSQGRAAARMANPNPQAGQQFGAGQSVQPVYGQPQQWGAGAQQGQQQARPQQWGAPQQPQYGGAPQPQYGGAPQAQYGGAPQPQYGGAPQQQYAAPPQQYGAPAPQQQWGAPQNQVPPQDGQAAEWR